MLEFIKFSTRNNCNQNCFFLMIVGTFCTIDNRCTTMQLIVDFFNNSFRITGNNHSLHPLLLGKDGICHPTRNKNRNHRIKRIFPPKGHTCNNHNHPIDNKRNISDISACFLPNCQTDNVCPTTRNIGTQSKANSHSHNDPTKQCIDNWVIC